MVRKYGKELPSFPLQREGDISKDNVEQVGEFLGVFMKRAVNIAFYDDELQHFLDILPEKLGTPPPTKDTASSTASTNSANSPAAGTTRCPAA
jgi:hypothetical protein